LQIKQLIANQLLNLQFDLRIAKCQQLIANKLLDLQFDLRIAKCQQLIANQLQITLAQR
jgi:hypothetical protein